MAARRKEEAHPHPVPPLSKAAKRFFAAVEKPKKPNEYLKKMFRLYGNRHTGALRG